MLRLVMFVIATAFIFGCAAGPQLAAPVTPQQITLTLDASDGGTITIGGPCDAASGESSSCGGGEVWLDGRGGSATSEQHGNQIDAAVPIHVDTSLTH